MPFLSSHYVSNFLHLFFPHNCEGCGSDILREDHFLCTRCKHRLPETHFLSTAFNPIEKLFYGRLPLIEAGAAFYFTKESLLQHLLIQLKYKANKEAGYFLGRMMGYALQKTERFQLVDMIVPLPLNAKKEQLRGYNQASLICSGLADIWSRPIENHAVTRILFTESQTRQNRISRWQNMEGVFSVSEPKLLENKHILLIDDVITTGATLEACGSAILQVPGTRLSIASIAYTL
jgi:ComF family protein